MKIYNKQYREKIKIYEKNRRKIDFNFKLAHNITVRTPEAFKFQNVIKINKFFDLKECSQSFLREFFYQLHGNIPEESYVWTIDHCYPFSKTNISNETHMLRSSHWINLRPMFYKNKCSKGSKIDNRLYLLQEVKARNFF